MPEPAEAVWGHCVAVLRDGTVAADAAEAAVRRGGRSRSLALAHARYQALLRTPTAPPGPDFDGLDPIGLALALSATRPAEERAVLDLEGRVDRGRLARALGVAPARAAALATEAAATWERELDPALLAWLGPGDCHELAELLPSAERLEDLLDAAPAVAAHVAGCEACSDRRRAMVTVKALVAQAPLPPLPARVRAAAGAARFRLPASAPPPLDAGPGQRRGLAVLAVVVGVVLAAGTTTGLVIWRNHRRVSAVAAVATAPIPASTVVVSTTVVPLELAANAQGCAVQAQVVDDIDATVVLHWRGGSGPEQAVPLIGPAYKTILAPTTVPVTWWVTATDQRGAQARTPDAVVTPGAC